MHDPLQRVLDRCQLVHSDLEGAGKTQLRDLFAAGKVVVVSWYGGPLDGMRVLIPKRHLPSKGTVEHFGADHEVCEHLDRPPKFPARYIFRIRKKKEPRLCWDYKPRARG